MEGGWRNFDSVALCICKNQKTEKTLPYFYQMANSDTLDQHSSYTKQEASWNHWKILRSIVAFHIKVKSLRVLYLNRPKLQKTVTLLKSEKMNSTLERGLRIG